MVKSHSKPKGLPKETKRTTSFKKSRSGNPSTHSQDAESSHGRSVVDRQSGLTPSDDDFGGNEPLEDTPRGDIGIEDSVDNQRSPSREIQMFEFDEEYLSSLDSRLTVDDNVSASNVGQPRASHYSYVNNPQNFSSRYQLAHCGMTTSSACPQDQRSFSYDYQVTDNEMTAPTYSRDGFQSYVLTNAKTQDDSLADRNGQGAHQTQLTRWAYETSDHNLTMTERLEKSNWQNEKLERL